MIKNWIAQNIDPPGMEKKNRGSIISAIGKVFDVVHADAEKAFKAHFPYLADLPTLRKHGKSLSVPELPYDTENCFRERVSAASFYLARAGERAYIHEQLKMRYGEQYLLEEDFLQVVLKVIDNSGDVRWGISFLDEILDPNIIIFAGELYNFEETLTLEDELKINIVRHDVDYPGHSIKYNGTIKYDGKTVNETILSRIKYNGDYKYNCKIKYKDIDVVNAAFQPVPPFKYSPGIVDTLNMSYSDSGIDDSAGVEETFSLGIRKHRYYNGCHKYNGAIKFDSSVFVLLE